MRRALPADGDVEAETAFSNRLVHLCQLTPAAFVEAAVRKGEKTARKASDGPSTGDPVGEFDIAHSARCALAMSAARASHRRRDTRRDVESRCRLRAPRAHCASASVCRFGE